MQLPTAIVMVRPASFGFNPETASTILFQREPTEISRRDIERRARIEFDMLAGRLREAGVEIILFKDMEDLHTPDAVFPNNWVSFHHDGTVVLYPMLAPSRRPERRRDIIEKLQSGGFRVSRIADLTHHENNGRFLEGTGSVVFDHVSRRAYAAISPRTNPEVLKELCDLLGYEPVTFHAVKESGQAILHTDMILSIGDRFSLFCGECIANASERNLVLGPAEKSFPSIANRSRILPGMFCSSKAKTATAYWRYRLQPGLRFMRIKEMPSRNMLELWNPLCHCSKALAAAARAA